MRETLRVEPAAIALTARQAARRQTGDGPEGRLLLVIDQFEQLFTQVHDPAQQKTFLEALGALTASWLAPAVALIGVRADFEARCAEEEVLASAIQTRYLVRSLTPLQMRAAIVEPARMVGADVEPALVETLLTELDTGGGPGVLPLLSHALDQAWRQRNGPDLTLNDYDRTGGAEQAVATTAQQTYDALPTDQKQLAKEMFLSLTVTDAAGRDVAMRLSRRDLHAGHDPAAVNAVIEAFTDQRLLTVGADTVELSHEAVLTAWPLLRDDWLAESHGRRLVLSRLRLAAAEWERNDHDPAYLYTGSLLEDSVLASEHETLPLAARQFIGAGTRRRRAARHRRQGLLAGLVAACLALTFLTWTAKRSANEAIRQRDIAVASRLVQLSADTTDPTLARLEAVAANTLVPNAAAREALLRADANPALATIPAPRGVLRTAAISPDGQWVAALADIGRIYLWNRQTGALVHTLKLVPDVLGGSPDSQAVVGSVAFSPDSARLVATSSDHDLVREWSVASGQQIGHDIHAARSAPWFSTVAYSADGRLLITTDWSGTVQLWNASTTAPVGTPLTASIGPLVSGTLTPNGQLVAVANGRISVWRPRPGGQWSLRSQRRVPVNADALDPSDDLLAVNDGGQTRVLSIPTLRNVGQALPTGQASAMAFQTSTGPLLVATHDQAIHLWSWRTGRQVAAPLLGHTNDITSVGASADGMYAASTGSDSDLRVWEPGLTEPLSEAGSIAGPQTAVWALAWSPNGALLATPPSPGRFDSGPHAPDGRSDPPTAVTGLHGPGIRTRRRTPPRR